MRQLSPYMQLLASYEKLRQTPNAEEANRLIDQVRSVLDDPAYSDPSFQLIILGILRCSLSIAGRDSEAVDIDPHIEQVKQRAAIAQTRRMNR